MILIHLLLIISLIIFVFGCWGLFVNKRYFIILLTSLGMTDVSYFFFLIDMILISFILIISLIIFLIGCWGLFVNKRNIVIFMFLDIIYFAGLFLFFKIYGFKLYLFSFFIGYWSLVNNLYVIKLISAEIMYFAALFYFFEAYAFNLSFFESVHLTLMYKISSNADEEFYLLQSFIHEVHCNQFFISEFYVNTFYNLRMKSHLIEYLDFFRFARIDAIPSNFIDELNYNTYIQVCDDSIDFIIYILDESTLRNRETLAYYDALEDDDYHTNLFLNGYN